jgi:glutamate-ammonia-ligase adenylyltransferase
MSRAASLRSSLVRLGIVDPERAERLLSGGLRGLVGDEGQHLDRLSGLAGVADPDQALLLLDRLLDASPADLGLAAQLGQDPDATGRLLEVLGMSQALGDFLVRHPERWSTLADGTALSVAPSREETRATMLEAVGADPTMVVPVAQGASREVLDRMRIAYRSCLLGIAARDLAGLAVMDTVADWLSDLADAVLEAGLAVARAGLPAQAADCRFAVVGLGKCGGRELNYVSDVDVIFVAEASDPSDETAGLRTATSLATGLMRACNEVTEEGSIWEVDANLRPEGRQGALVRTLASHVDYYQRWAKTWEYQALLKARPVAGDLSLGEQYVNAVAPFTWSAADHEGFVEDVQAMRQRVEANVPAKIADRELKLGPGGLRDVEFCVQLLQLVHGRSDVMLRSPTTLVALESLAVWGYVGRDDAASLAEAYRFLRTLEHRIQLQQLRRTHTMPEAEADLRRLGRSMGFRADPIADLGATWRRHAREVRRLHEKLFYRPLLRAVARLDAGEARLTAAAAEQRLQALGYADPAGALRHIESLTSGVSRRAAIQRTLLPVLLGWFADGPDPDAGLLGFRRVSDDLGSTHWFLRLLRDESVAAERLAQVLSTSRYATDLLLRAPESVTMLADESELQPRSLDSLLTEAGATVARHDDPTAAVAGVRALRRRELFRLAVAVLNDTAEQDDVGASLSNIASATISGALDAATRSVLGAGEYSAVRITVIGMGRLGGGELGFGSDVDVMFVYDAQAGVDDTVANRTAFAIANELRSLLMAPSSDPPLDVDADLRPEGRQGPLVRSLASYAAYYQRWSAGWEAQALLRARPIAGDPVLGEQFTALIDELRYPSDGIGAEAVREIRRLKARMEAERLPRGADPTLHTKLGRGGLSDVEWVVQLLQLQYGGELPALRTTGTLPALQAATVAGLVDESDAEALRASWRMATAVRNATMLVRGSASDMVPSSPRDLRGIGYVLGYPLDGSAQLLDDYRRLTRRARQVMERLFYELD